MTMLGIAPPKNSDIAPRTQLGMLDQVDAAKLIMAASDLSLIIDKDGIIQEVAVGSEELLKEDFSNWVGQRWIDTVTVESRVKVEELLAQTKQKGSSYSRHINHPSSGAADIAIRYTVVTVGSGGRIVAVGRDLRNFATLQRRLIDAQQSMEREYFKLRNSETRYRLLFQIASEAVLILDAATDKILEVNPVAERLLVKAARRITGHSITEFFNPSAHSNVEAMLSAVRSAGRAEDFEAELSDGSMVSIAASLFRQENSAHILVRVTPISEVSAAVGPARAKSTLLKVVDKMPDGFVVTDPQWRILTVNPAFLDLAQLPNEDMATSETLQRYLGRTEVEFEVLAQNLREHGSVRQFSTTFRNQYGTIENIEVTAVAVHENAATFYGFALRREPIRVSLPLVAGRDAPRSVEQLTGLVGRVSLKDLVRESTDLIERLAIEAALELTGDNRASAADMLGLSRQSLYVKLRRYGLGDLDGQTEN